MVREADGCDEHDENRVNTALLQNGRAPKFAADGDCYEYATLECRLSTADAVQSVPVHLQVAFNDNGDAADDLDEIVLTVNAVVVAQDPDIGGGYQGHESGRQAAADSRSSAISTARAVGDWSKNAYSALIGDHPNSNNNVVAPEHRNSNNNAVPSEYEYYLKRIESRDGQCTLLEFGWRIKLRPFGTMVLGKVLLSKMNPSEFVNRVSAWFVKPLISDRLAEREHRIEAERVASVDIKKLSEDNKRLLDTLDLVNNTKELEDQRKIVQFMKVLNAKKQKLIAVTQELSELKQQRSHSMPTTIETEKEESKSVMNQQLNRSKRSKTMTVDDKLGTIKKKRPKTQYGNKNCTVFSEEDQQKDIPVDGNIFFTNIITEDLNSNESPPWFQDQLPTEEQKQIHTIDTIKQEMELMEVVNKCSVNSLIRNVSTTTEVSSTVINVPVVDSIFTADTQIDEDNTRSPSLLQHESPIRPTIKMEPILLLPSSSNNDVYQENKKMTAFDHLWSGIA